MEEERRKYIRYEIPLAVEFKLKDSSAYSPGVTKNFSRAGLCFESEDTGLQLKEIVDLRVKLPNEDTFIQAIGDVMWKEKRENKCLIGVKLIAMDAAAKSQILDKAYDRWVAKMR